MGQTLRFQRKFKPLTVEIEGLNDAVYKFQTVPITRSIERELGEVLEKANERDINSAVELMDAFVDGLLAQMDKVLVPEKGKKKLASKVFRELWEADELESRDLEDFLKDLADKRRPT